jgi:glutathione peroxidase
VFSFLSFLFPGKQRPIPESIYDFKVKALDGGIIDFAAFRGKKILIVNTASKCGSTPQYKGLQELYERHKDNLVVVGFPSNNFLFQEPGTDEEIAAFCKRNYDVTFPMAAKISVKGRKMAPIYRWLTQKKHNGYADSTVKWNFQKYLANEQGQLVAVFGTKAQPNDPAIIAAIGK